MVSLYLASVPPPSRPQFLLCAPRVAGLLPAHAESLNQPSVLLTDHRLESVPSFHYHTLVNATRRLFHAAVDYIISQDEDDEVLMNMASLDFIGGIGDLFHPIIEVETTLYRDRPKPERLPTIAEMDAALQPIIDEIIDIATNPNWKPPTKGGKSA